jgi:hypothetical protein
LKITLHAKADLRPGFYEHTKHIILDVYLFSDAPEHYIVPYLCKSMVDEIFELPESCLEIRITASSEQFENAQLFSWQAGRIYHTNRLNLQLVPNWDEPYSSETDIPLESATAELIHDTLRLWNKEKWGEEKWREHVNDEHFFWLLIEERK